MVWTGSRRGACRRCTGDGHQRPALWDLRIGCGGPSGRGGHRKTWLHRQGPGERVSETPALSPLLLCKPRCVCGDQGSHLQGPLPGKALCSQPRASLIPLAVRRSLWHVGALWEGGTGRRPLGAGRMGLRTQRGPEGPAERVHGFMQARNEMGARRK